MDKNIQDGRDRLEKLKQATILNYGENIDFNSTIELYENMLAHVFNGDYQELFTSEYLDGVEDKDKIFKLANKYMSLCFYQGDFDYWLDSIEGICLSDLDLICIKILDNYDFLLRIADSGGEEALKELVKFQKMDAFNGNSVIDHLRNVFFNDNVLEHTIIEMSTEDGAYSKFSDIQKMVLCSAPEGIIYDLEESKVYKKVSVIDTLSLIKKYVLGDEDSNYSEEDFGKILKSMSDSEFEDIVYALRITYKEVSDEHKK